MLNHRHGIVVLTDDATCKKRHGLPEIIRGFKTFSARCINKMSHLSDVSVCQRGYYEHIIRHEESLEAIREYIIKNPLAWENDELYPNNSTEWNGKIKNLALPINRIM